MKITIYHFSRTNDFHVAWDTSKGEYIVEVARMRNGTKRPFKDPSATDTKDLGAYFAKIQADMIAIGGGHDGEIDRQRNPLDVWNFIQGAGKKYKVGFGYEDLSEWDGVMKQKNELSWIERKKNLKKPKK